MKRTVYVAAIATTSLLVACSSAQQTDDTGTARTVPAADIVAKCQPPYAGEAAKAIDATPYKKDTPWVLGVSAAYLSNSFINYFNQEIKYGVSKDSRFSKVVVTDAAFNASKQVSDIDSLITQGVDAIVYWPVDSKATAAVLQKAKDAGIATIQATGGYTGASEAVADVQIDFYSFTVTSAIALAEAMEGHGDIAQVGTIPGTTGNTQQDEALKCVLSFYPDIHLVDTQYGNFATPDSKTIAETWVQRFPNLDGVLSVYAEPSMGVAQAYQEAGKLSEIKISPSNASNGWLKFLAANKESNLGVVSYPVSLGETTAEVVAKILSGESVPRGTFEGSEFISPEEAASQADPSKPDSYWPNDMPAAFQPKS
jgi:ABC-type sugar transport system substrate-binding protein